MRRFFGQEHDNLLQKRMMMKHEMQKEYQTFLATKPNKGNQVPTHEPNGRRNSQDNYTKNFKRSVI